MHQQVQAWQWFDIASTFQRLGSWHSVVVTKHFESCSRRFSQQLGVLDGKARLSYFWCQSQYYSTSTESATGAPILRGWSSESTFFLLSHDPRLIRGPSGCAELDSPVISGSVHMRYKRQLLRGYKQYTYIKLYKNNRYLQYLLKYVSHSSGYNN